MYTLTYENSIPTAPNWTDSYVTYAQALQAASHLSPFTAWIIHGPDKEPLARSAREFNQVTVSAEGIR